MHLHIVYLVLFVIFEFLECIDIVSKSLFGHISNGVLSDETLTHFGISINIIETCWFLLLHVMWVAVCQILLRWHMSFQSFSDNRMIVSNRRIRTDSRGIRLA